MKKTAVVIGHTEDSPGAKSPFNISAEWEFNFGIGADLNVRGMADIFLYDTYKKGYTSMVTRNAAQVNAGNYDLIIELHYNSSDNASANGCEALYYHKPDETFNEKKIAEYFCQRMHEELGLKNRGAKQLTKNDRGYAATYYPKGDCLILEPFFGSNKSDVEKITEGYYKYIEIIEELIEM